MNRTVIATNDALVAAHISVISSITGSTLMGGAKALLIEEAKRQMRAGVCHFVYLKKDGTVREAYGTLNSSLIAKHILGTGISPEFWGASCYWDIEKGAFRSFKWENIVAVL